MNRPWSGKAAPLLRNNPYEELIRQRATESENQSKKSQLYCAVRVDSWQCDNCCHYFSSIKKLAVHKKYKDCRGEDFQIKSYYVKDERDRFFCYFGCTKKFELVEHLEQHLFDSHEEDELKLWGISWWHLERKFSN